LTKTPKGWTIYKALELRRLKSLSYKILILQKLQGIRLKILPIRKIGLKKLIQIKIIERKLLKHGAMIAITQVRKKFMNLK
jgi:hypothetical protein